MAGVSFMSFAADGRTLVAVSDAIRTWDVATGAERSVADLSALGMGGLGASASASFGVGSGFALSPDGAQLALVSVEGGSKAKVRLLDTATGREARSLNLSGVDKPHELYRAYPAFARDGRLVVAGVDGGKLKVWDAAGKPQTLASVPDEHRLRRTQPRRRRGRGGARRLQAQGVGRGDGARGRVARRAARRPLQGRVDLRLRLQPRRAAPRHRRLRRAAHALGRVERQAKLRALEGHSNVAYNVAFSADGTRLTSGARTVWDLRTGQGLRVVPGEGRIYGFPTADGKLLAVITLGTSAVRVVETATGRTLHTLAPAGGGGQVAQFASSLDGRLLAVHYMQTTEEAERAREEGCRRVREGDPGGAEAREQEPRRPDEGL